MAKRYYSEINSTKPKIEDWDNKAASMPEQDLGDHREGLDKNIRENNIKKSKISPRGC